jgi:hypothetical protein
MLCESYVLKRVHRDLRIAIIFAVERSPGLDSEATHGRMIGTDTKRQDSNALAILLFHFFCTWIVTGV